jgi:type I restriction-modification system DNA methylase subunit
MITKEEAYKIVQQLTERFAEQIDSYKSGEYNETQTRRDFIDPLFKALGWDVDNSDGNAEAYREVIHEDKVKVGKATKAPDYSFRLAGGKRLFFVEAKKPSVDIKGDISVAYQIRRYGWSAKLPVSIITDFAELAVYDCTKKPNPSDKSSIARIKYLTFDKYLVEFEYLWDTFSKERVLKGSFDKYVQSDTVRKGTATVDKEFLITLDTWRTYLATSISIKNKQLDEDEINFAVQQIIDRLIFLRIAEDRGVEPYGQLKMAVNTKGDSYQNLFSNFKKADEKYNSGLFDFKKDVISESLTIDNKVINTIVGEMYYPESPYEFSVLSVEILGSAYEQFLGKQIRIDTAHRAKIEEKPEVRKAGGVYYTPHYVVDYIVENTVGKLIEGKTPKQIEKIKIADPACGSGSFLIGAYQHLLDYHKRYYNEKETKSGKKDSPITPEGNLTSAEKKRILLNNIYGVDIDVNAVEVTKLSLLLKCMEGETATSIAQQQKLWHERILPTLDNNIKSGNSLVDTDYYDSVLDFGEEKKIKPFNWQKAFSEIFNQGGFDIIIGNPPYVFGRDWKALGISDELKTYFGRKFKSSPYQLDMFSIFMEQAFNLVKPNGYVSYIVPNVWLNNTYSVITRKFIIQNSSKLIITETLEKVFEGITVDTIIFISERGKYIPTNNIDIYKLSQHSNYHFLSLPNEKYSDGENPISTSISNSDSIIIQKIKENGIELGKFANVTRGVHPYRVGGYGISAFVNGYQIQKDVDERPYHSKVFKPDYRPFIYGKDLKRFEPLITKEYIKYGKWLAEPREPMFFEGERIYSRKILGQKLLLTIENGNSVADQQVYITKPLTTDIKVEYLAGIMGSNLMAFFIRKYYNEVNDAFPQIKVGQLKALPIKKINPKNNNEVEKSNLIIQLIQLLFNTNKELQLSKLPDKIEQLKTKIDHTEKRINQLVYELYDLTDEEITIINS